MASLFDLLSSRIAWHHAHSVYDRFVRSAKDAVRVQQRVLQQKLHRQAHSEFGREHGLARIRSYEDFTRQVPIRTYQQYEPYIQRVLHGEPNALLGTGQKILMFALTSGTTAEPKYIPVTEEFLAEYRAGWSAWGLKALLDHPAAILRGIGQMASPMDERFTDTLIPCGAITGLTARTQTRLVRKFYVVPPQTAYIADAATRYYSVMRFAITRDVGWLIAANPSTLIRLAESANTCAEPLIRDICDGTLTLQTDLPQQLQNDLRALCKPDPARAAALEECIRRSGSLRPADYWNVNFLACWTGGTMGLYLKDLAPWFGPAPVRDIGLIASEGRMTIPVDDGTPSGILDVAGHFYEFIPSGEIDSPSPAVLRCHELQVGQEYFLLLTTSSGLLRYSIMDLVRVTGTFGQTPIVEFLSKGQRICSIAGEKLTENQVVLAARAIEQQTNGRLGDFALCPCWATLPGYTLYVDRQCDIPADLLASRFDEQLCHISIEYASKRKTLRLAALQVRRLPAGFLADLDKQAIRRSQGRTEQFKHRFLYTTPGDDETWPAI